MDGIEKRSSGYYYRNKQLTDWLADILYILEDDYHPGEFLFLVRIRGELYLIPFEVFTHVNKLRTFLIKRGLSLFTSSSIAVSHLFNLWSGGGEVKQVKLYKTFGRFGDSFVWHSGLHVLPDCVVLPNETSASLLSLDFEGPAVNRSQAQEIFSLLLGLNEPGVMYPVLGWFGAAFFKPLINKGRNFPLLNVYGSTGAGKTEMLSLVATCFGSRDVSLYSTNMTEFTKLNLLSASNCFPVIIDEYRPSQMSRYRHNQFIHMLVELYTSNEHTRGQKDLTVRHYKLISPVVVCGEEPLETPALQTRTIYVSVNGKLLLGSGGKQYVNAFNKLRSFEVSTLNRFGTFVLEASKKFDFKASMKKIKKELLNDQDIREVISLINNRHLHNLTAIITGFKFLQEATGIYVGDYMHDTGLCLLEIGVKYSVFDFIEFILNAITDSTELDYKIDSENKLVYIPSAQSYRLWQRSQRDTGEVISKRALNKQIKETDGIDYIQSCRFVSAVRPAYVIDINDPKIMELDVPEFSEWR